MQLTHASRAILQRQIKAEGGYSNSVLMLEGKGLKVCRTLLWRLVNGKLKNPIKQTTMSKIITGFEISESLISFDGETSIEKTAS